MSEQPSGIVAALIPAELNDDLRFILGLVCFRAAPYADVLRLGGQTIKGRAEDEQAAVILWLLRHYFSDPDRWRTNADAELKAIRVFHSAKAGGATS